MITLLGDIVEIFENIPAYILYAIEQFVNAFFAAITVVLEVANETLGGLPEVSTPPAYVGEINWFYPVGTMLSVAAPLLTAYVAWLGISWIYRKYGAL
jgi:hypothetical protein